MAANSCIPNSRYAYIHEDGRGKNGPLEAIDVHNVLLLRNTNSKLLLTFISALLLTATAFSLLSLKQGESNNMLLWSLLLSATLVIIFLGKRVEKESVIIMPSFGVQLETHYRRGRTIHRFIPMDKILKPVLSECVTPVTCYWSLSLLVRDEEELSLVFKELHPPVKILISVWKALCAATDSPETLDQPG